MFILTGVKLIKLTKKQQDVLDYLRQYIAERRSSPLIREVQAGCQIASYKSTIDRLNALERKGFIRRKPSQHRGIRIVSRRVESHEAQETVEHQLQAEIPAVEEQV